jgi:putative Holliday junction resolvase
VSDAPGRILALDYGEVRLGLALSDELGLIAQPLETIRRVGPRKDLAAIEQRVREHGVTRVVVGLPLLLSGEEGEAARGARRFAARLEKRLRGVTVSFWDERLTTVEAERTLVTGEVRRRKRRQTVDALAASLILQGYLDARATRGGVEEH